MRAPFKAAVAFGIADCPGIIEDMESKGRLRSRALGQVVYHCDVSTLYTGHEDHGQVKADKKRMRKHKAW